MGQCLVTTLKEAATDTSLRKLGEMRIHITPDSGTEAESHRIMLSASENIQVYIDGNGYFTDETRSGNLGREITIGAISKETATLQNATALYLSDGEYDVCITNKYALLYLVLGGTSSGEGQSHKQFDISQTRGCLNLIHRNYYGISTTGTLNHIIYDDLGNAGEYVEMQPVALNRLVTGAPAVVHPAFLVNGVQRRVYIGKYQGCLVNNRMCSRYGQVPATFLQLEPYDQYCRNKGKGHHCITAAEWAFRALLARKNGHIPLGNTYYGKDPSESAYLAIPVTKGGDGRTNCVAPGTGPVTWSDTGDVSGAWDLSGNLWEWTPGIRLVMGELQVIPYNNAASPDIDMGENSGEWRAVNAAATSYGNLFINPDGSGTTSGSVKLNYVNSHWQWDTDITDQQKSSRNAPFANTTYAGGLSAFCKMYLRAMALGPEDGETNYGGGYLFAMNGEAERTAHRGGNWYGNGGIFALSFDSSRTSMHPSFGGRPAFYD